MPVIRLIGITREGAPAKGVAGLPEVALEACASTASLYQKAGFLPPWIGYLALCDSDVVPKRNASNAILRKLGFELSGQIIIPSIAFYARSRQP
jgi:hypothetical protein